MGCRFPFLVPRILAALLAAVLLAISGVGSAQRAPEERLRIGLTPVFLDDQVSFLRDWQSYLERRLGRRIVFVQRGNYREVVDMLRQGKLDFAWVCGYPYVRYPGEMELLAVPLYQGQPLYRSYLIVPSQDTASRNWEDLRGKVFAYSDPDSNSGFLYPQYVLAQENLQADRFFGRTFFSWSHRNVVEAVAAGLAQGGAVDGYVWETLRRDAPQLTGRTRVVAKSPEFGFPPFAARRGIPAAEFDAMQRVLLGMAHDPEGRALLARLNLDGFAPGDGSLFEGIRAMFRRVNGS